MDRICIGSEKSKGSDSQDRTGKTVANILFEDGLFQTDSREADDLRDMGYEIEMASDTDEQESYLLMDCESDGGTEMDESVNKETGTVIYNSSNNIPVTVGKKFEMTDESEKVEVELSADFVKDSAVNSTKNNQNEIKRKKGSPKPQCFHKSYKCTKCLFESKNYSDYILHLCRPKNLKGGSFTVTYHNDGKIYSCSCGHIYHKQKVFHEHLVCHMIAKPYRCSLCEETFASRKEILKHLASAHPKDKMRFYVNGLKFTENIMKKARLLGSYTQNVEEIKKTSIFEKHSTPPSKPKTAEIILQKPSEVLSQSKKDDVIIILDDDDDDDDARNTGVKEPAQAQVTEKSIKTVNPVPVSLFKNVCHQDLFRFVFSATGVTYSCTYCKKDWESRSQFCFHIWNHQHEGGKKCPECEQKEGESGVSCMMTIRLFRSLAFESFTKTKQEAERAGALKDLTFDRIFFQCSSDNVRSYKCLECNLDIPQLGKLKWHIWQHSHSSIVCPACSILNNHGIRYIVCPLVEKLVTKILQFEEQYYKVKIGMSLINEHAEDTNENAAPLKDANHSFMSKDKRKYGTIFKNNETVYVCYICCKQWADKFRFWLHAWTHVHDQRQPCPNCKKVSGFPGITCAMVDQNLNIPEFNKSKMSQEVEALPTLKEDMIITSFEPDQHSQDDQDIIIIDDTPGPGESRSIELSKVADTSIDKPQGFNAEELLSSSIGQQLASYPTRATFPGFENSSNDTSKAEETDEAEVIIDEADVTCTDISFSKSPKSVDGSKFSPSTSSDTVGSLNTITNLIPCQIVLDVKELMKNCNYPTSLRRQFLSDENLSKAISRFYCLHKNEFVCLICKCTYSVGEILYLFEHIVVRHIKIPLLQCGYCEFNSNKEYQIIGHSRSKHTFREPKILTYDIDIFESVEQFVKLIGYDRAKNLPMGFIEKNVLSEPVKDSFAVEKNTDLVNKDALKTHGKSEGLCTEPEKNNILNELPLNNKTNQDQLPQIVSTFSLAFQNQSIKNLPSKDIVKMERFSNSDEGDNFFPDLFVCGLCIYSTMIMEDLRTHLITKHAGEKQYPCKHCGFIGIRSEQLMKHLAYHASNSVVTMPVFQCIETNCEYRCNSLHGFLSHIDSHNWTKFECHECAETFSSLKELRCHYECNLLNIISCPHCPGVASNKAKILEHILNYHDVKLKEVPVGKQLLCRDRQLYGYKPKCNNVKNLKETANSVLNVLELNCKLCTYYAVSLTQLKAHEEVHSNIQVESAFVCPFCSAPFESHKDLADHIMKHAEIQMSIHLFTCSLDGYCTNVYQKILQHIHDGHHKLTSKPEEMYTYKQITLKSQVMCCPMCPFKSSCREYLTCHIEKVHQGGISLEERNTSSSSKIPSKPSNQLEAQANQMIIKEHAKTHSELNKEENDVPFSDINEAKKEYHVYIPTDGPDNQENLHLLATRIKKVFKKDGKNGYKCVVCNAIKCDQEKISRHVLVHLKIQYQCYMCNTSFGSLCRLKKHAKKSHNCSYFNIIYSDKLEEATESLIVESLVKKSSNVRPVSGVSSSDVFMKTDVDSDIKKKTSQSKSKEEQKSRSNKIVSNSDSNSNDCTSYPDESVLPSTESDSKLVQWSELASDKNICLLGSDYLNSTLSVLYTSVNNRHICKICKEAFPAVTRYWIHHHLNSKHLHIDLYKCGYCNFSAIEKFLIHQHLAKNHGDKSVEVCDIDVDIHKSVTDYVKTNMSELLSDSKDVTKKPLQSTDVMQYFRCEYCQRVFNYEIKAKIHCNVNHKGQEPKVTILFSKPNIQTVNKKTIQVESVKRRSSSSLPSTSKKPRIENEKVYKCPQCNFCTDVNLDAIHGHFRSHNYQKIIECSICKVRSFDEKASQKHHRIIHPTDEQKVNLLPVLSFFKEIKRENAPISDLSCYCMDKEFKFICTFCGLRSDLDNLMRDHLLTHFDSLKTLIVCSECKIPYPEIKTREHHFTNIHSSKINSKNLEKTKRDLNDALLECLQSGTIKGDAELSKNFLCVKCPDAFHSLFDLSRHSKSRHRLPCNMTIYWRDKITGCTYNVHGLMQKSKSGVDLKKFDVYLCKYCDFRTNVRKRLYDHYKIHPNRKLNRTIELRHTVSNTLGSVEMVCRCHVCSKLITGIPKFEQHLGSHGNIFKKLQPSSSDMKILRCRICNFESDSENAFKDHQKKHADFKQFSCAHCSFEANQNTVVKLHVRSAHPNIKNPADAAAVDMKSPKKGTSVNLTAKVKLKNFFDMTPHEFEHLLNKAGIQDVDLSTVPLEIAEKLLLAY